MLKKMKTFACSKDFPISPFVPFPSFGTIRRTGRLMSTMMISKLRKSILAFYFSTQFVFATGTGGREASLFAAEIYSMYQK